MFARLFVVSALALTQVFAAPIVKRQSFSGEGTFYHPEGDPDQNGAMPSPPPFGACGEQSNSNDMVVALNAPQWAAKAHCNQQITISYNGNSVVATIVDQCPGCAYGDIDMAPAVFNKLASPDLGRLFGITWSFGASGGGGAPAPSTDSAAPTTTSTAAPAPSSESPAPSPSEQAPSPAAPSPSPTTVSSAAPSTAPSASASESPASSLAASASASASPSVSAASASVASASAASALANSTIVPVNAAASASALPSAVTVNAGNTTTALPIDTVVASTDAATDDGNIAAFNNLVASFGRLIVVAAQ